MASREWRGKWRLQHSLHPFFSFSYCVFVSLLELVQHCVSVFVSNLPLIFHRKLLFFVVDVVCRLVALLVCLSFSLHTYIEVYICSFVVVVVVAALSCSFEIITYLLVFFYRLSRKKFPNMMRISFFFFFFISFIGPPGAEYSLLRLLLFKERRQP